MTYVIAQPCVDTKNGACVEVCPVDCIKSADGEPQFYIDPDLCIECEQCEIVCPVKAIFLDTTLPEEWHDYIEKNAGFFRLTKEAPMPIPFDQALQMIEAAHAKADELGIKVTAAVLDEGGRLIALGRMDLARPMSVDIAMNKAFTAASYQMPTHEMGNMAQQPWFASVIAASQGRIMAVGGGMPVLQGVNILGAVGVAGGTPDQDQQCCRAAATISW
jgi:ferredoxin